MKKNKIIPTESQLKSYSTMRRNGSVCRNTNLRFGRIVLATDADKDG